MVSTMVSTKDQDIQKRVACIIIEALQIEGVTAETFDPHLDLVDEFGVDSMDLATIALIIRDEFHIAIDEDDYPQLTTLAKIAAYIAGRQAATDQSA